VKKRRPYPLDEKDVGIIRTFIRNQKFFPKNFRLKRK
jgi:hypothetical protein